MQNTKLIYSHKLPHDLLDTLDDDSQRLIEFIVGTRLLEKADKYGLDWQITIGDQQDQTNLVEITILGEPYWIAVWLLDYEPRYP